MVPSLLLGSAGSDEKTESPPLVRVAFREASDLKQVQGRIVVEAADGGILLQDRSGQLWTIPANRLASRESTDDAFEPYSQEELGTRLQAEFGDGFRIVTTRHYCICTNTNLSYARWCGALFERLYGAFHRHWRTSRLDLHEPQFPLVAIVFRDRRQFDEYAAKDARLFSDDAIGYYSARTNRIVLYDLTSRNGAGPPRSPDEIVERLSDSLWNVATIVHEATHQIAFNTGVHTRYADNPLWLTEGLAQYFEMPDLKSRSGWRTVGQVNTARYQQFRDYLKRRPADSLTTLITRDDRFRNAETAGDAYAEAWALTYFLIRARRPQYAAYLKRLAAKPPLVWDSPEQRLADFQAAFGDDLERLEKDWMAFMRRVRIRR